MLRLPQTQGKIKVVSFDVDGTLVSPGFVDAVWLEGIPQLYAAKAGVGFEQAVAYVRREYEKIGEHRIEWYNIAYWLRKFGLEIPYEEIFTRYEALLRIYDDVEPVLAALREAGYTLIVSSNAATEFIEFQTKPIKGYFTHVFSATSDFGQVKKTNGFFARVCRILGVEPEAMVHVGDHWVFDFLNPRKIGITAFYLDREQKGNGTIAALRGETEYIIRDLDELLDDPGGPRT